MAAEVEVDEGETTLNQEQEQELARSHVPDFTIEVGQRVRAGMRVGTVRYIGEVDGVAKNTYIGIEYDEGEGKNDGCGPTRHRYFRTKRTGCKAAAFFPLSVIEKEFKGIAWSLNAAIHDKYSDHFQNEEVEVGQDAGLKKVEFLVSATQSQTQGIFFLFLKFILGL